MLKRTHRKAQMELNRAQTLDAAMSIVLNRREEMEESFFDPTRYMVNVGGTGSSGVIVPVESLYNAAMGQGAMGAQNIANTQNIANNKAAQQARGMGMHP
jgi:hypothetical protein